MVASQASFFSTGSRPPRHSSMQRAATRAAETPVAQHCRAVKRSLGQLDLRSLGNGRYLMPVLDPARDSLPFAMALELHERTSGAEDNCPSLLWGQAQPEEGLYALRYMLDCEPQAALGQGRMPLRPGDSVLTPYTADTWTVDDHGTPFMGGATPEWRLASITLLLPKALQQTSSGEVYLDSTLAERSAQEWHAAPIVGSLPPEAVTSLMTAARDRTRAAFPALHAQPHSTALESLSHAQLAHNLPTQDAHTSAPPSPPHDARASSSHAATSTGIAHAESVYRRLSAGAHIAVWGGQGFNPVGATSTVAEHAFSNVPEHASDHAWGFPAGRIDGKPDQAARSSNHVTNIGEDLAASTEGAREGTGGVLVPSNDHMGRGQEEGAASTKGDREGSGDAGSWGPLAHFGAAGELIWAGGLTGALAYILPSIAERIAGRLKRAAPRVGPLRRGLQDLNAFQLPNQTNRLALVFDPLSDDVPFTFGVEIFLPGHKTTPHTHPTAHELFFILAGEGEAFCDGVRFPVAPGDVVVFPPTSVHGIDTSPSHGKMYCLEMMTTNDMFAEMVRSGTAVGTLPEEDLCVLAAVGCS